MNSFLGPLGLSSFRTSKFSNFDNFKTTQFHDKFRFKKRPSAASRISSAQAGKDEDVEREQKY